MSAWANGEPELWPSEGSAKRTDGCQDLVFHYITNQNSDLVQRLGQDKIWDSGQLLVSFLIDLFWDQMFGYSPKPQWALIIFSQQDVRND